MKATMMVISLFFLYNFAYTCNEFKKVQQSDSDTMLVIQKMSQVHCARGPKNCEKCKEMAKERHYCLLRLDAGTGKEARPVVQIEDEGEMKMFEYEVAIVFRDKQEAMTYAAEHSVRVVNSAGK